MSAATDKALGELHATVARVLTSAISSEEVPSAAVLSAAITFLKNNNITASPTDNAELAELNRKLVERRKEGKDNLRSQLDQVDTLMDANYTAIAGGSLQ